MFTFPGVDFSQLQQNRCGLFCRHADTRISCALKRTRVCLLNVGIKFIDTLIIHIYTLYTCHHYFFILRPLTWLDSAYPVTFCLKFRGTTFLGRQLSQKLLRIVAPERVCRGRRAKKRNKVFSKWKKNTFQFFYSYCRIFFAYLPLHFLRS